MQCVLNASSENVNYKLHYYCFDADSVNLSSANAFSNFLASDTNYNGKIPRNHSLTVVGM